MQRDDRVSAQDHHNFWWWPGVQLPSGLDIHRVYVLSASLNNRGNIVHYRQTPPRLRKIVEVVVVIRLEQLADATTIAKLAGQEVAAWRLAGNNVRGIQIDFDSGTTALDNYTQFLTKLRQELELNLLLSVTGLMDWGNARDYDMQALTATVDEIVFQTYQGKSTLHGYPAYIDKITALGIPFKVGLVSDGQFSAKTAQQLAAEDNFQGYVVFLLASENQ